MGFLSLVVGLLAVLAGCEPVMVLDPKGPQAETIADVIWISIAMMAIVVVAVFSMLVYIVVKYRASKQSADYEPRISRAMQLLKRLLSGFQF